MLNEFYLKFKCEKCGNLINKVYPARNLNVMIAGLNDKPLCKTCGNKKGFLIIGTSSHEVKE